MDPPQRPISVHQFNTPHKLPTPNVFRIALLIPMINSVVSVISDANTALIALC